MTSELESFEIYPAISVPEGISAEKSFPIVISLEQLPEMYQDSPLFEVSLLDITKSLKFPNDDPAVNISIVSGKGQTMATLRRDMREFKLMVCFSFNGRHCGCINITLPN